MTEAGKKMLEHVKADPDMHRGIVESYAAKARRTYGDEDAAKKLEAIAAQRDEPRSHLTEEQREEIRLRDAAAEKAERAEKRLRAALKKGGL